MPIQSEVLVPQKVTVLPNQIVTLTAPSACTFRIKEAHIPGNGILTQTAPNACTVQSSENMAEWGEIVVEGELSDGNFGLAEVYFLVPFVISPAGEE